MSLKVKLISAISLFILMLGALILGVFAASQQTITMQGNITFNVSDRSLYVKAVRYQATGEEAIDVTSFSQGYINENFNLDLTSLSQAEPNKHGSFTLYFDIINATNMQWAIESVTLSETLISEGVTESHSGIIEVNELTETDSEGFKVFDVATAPYDTLSLTIIAPQASTTNPLNLSDITITIKEYIPPEITDFTFARTSENTGVAVRYTGAETEVEIPETFSVITEQLEEPGYTIEIKTQEDYMALFGDEYFPLVLMSGYYYITTPLLGRVYVTDYELFSQTLTEAAGGTIDVTDIIPMTIEVTDYEIIYQDFISSEYTQYAIIKPFMEISMGEVENVTIEFNSGEKYEINAINYIELLYVIQYNSLYLYEEVNFPVKISYPSTKVTYVEGDDYFVTSLGGMAFSDNVNITSITIPDGITSIGSQAFSGCSNLYSVSLPSSLTSVGEDAFTGCTSLNYYKEDGASYLGNVNNPYVYLANVTTTVTEYTINSNTKFIGDNAFSGNSTLTSVTIPEEVTSIGSSAFQSCSGLINITIPTGVVYIGSNAFENCSNLKNITIPTGVTIINEGTFSDCSGLTNVFFENNSQLTSIGASAFSGCSSLTDITIPSGVTIIGNSAFARSGLTSITIPDGVNDIGLMTFLSCESLKNVTLSETLIIVGGWAFSSCSSLESIIIPEGVISIGQAAFSGCSSLTDITIPSSVTSIGNSAFNGCTLLNCYIDEFGVSYLGNENEHYIYLADAPTTLTEYTINNNCVTIGDNAFSGCSNLASITIPENVTGINESAFEDCSSLTNITIPSGVTSIEDYTFRNCSGLTSITLPSSLTSIGWYAFDGCSSLTNVNLPNTLTSIGYRAFYNCSGLSNITIPEGVTSIESYAFEDCISLTSITLPSTLTNIGWSAFENCSSLESITLPSALTSIESRAFYNCSSLTEMNYLGTLADWCAIDFGDSASNPTYYTGALYIQGQEITTLNIPEGVTSIGDYAFYNCSNLTSITLPSSLTSIGINYVFYNCSGLESISVEEGNEVYKSEENCLIEIASKTLILGCNNSVIPDDGSVTSIRSSAFYNCNGLTSITIPEGVTSIGFSVFENCSELTSVSLPSTLTSIGSYAFRNCSSLTSITIPESVTSIDLWAFRYCDNLTTVTINEYIYTNASSSSSCGYILENAQTVYVPEELVNNSALTMGSYLQNYFTQEELVNGLYTYTRN